MTKEEFGALWDNCDITYMDRYCSYLSIFSYGEIKKEIW